MITIQSGEAEFVIGVAQNCNDSCLGLKFWARLFKTNDVVS